MIVAAMPLAIVIAVAVVPPPGQVPKRLSRTVDGQVTVEAEHASGQTFAERRAWHVVTAGSPSFSGPDGDPPHVDGASAGAYLEILPDTRRTHDDRLIPGENFSNEPGKLAVLSYDVHFDRPGRYYVWVRAYSTGGEDNGVHVGLDGKWPASGQRMQWCEGKKTWRWESRQRTEQQHCGVPGAIYLDVDRAGPRVVQFSMREDGFEFDAFTLTTNAQFVPPGATPPREAQAPRAPDGNGSVIVSGELRRWHEVTLTLDGPFADERDQQPNPFTDHRMNVTFTHSSGSPRYVVPGYFAADGNAANSSATRGTKWRAHLSPDKPGAWTYEISFVTGRQVAIGNDGGRPLAPFDGKKGQFRIGETNKRPPDLRGRGRLTYVGKHHLRFAGTGEYFLKAGPDAPETLLGYADFDGTEARKAAVPLKTWAPHLRDFKQGDPTWKDAKGKGLIGALNYVASKGLNSISFLTYNAGGDGDNVWPFVERDLKLHYDCSKLDQWAVVFRHAQKLGLYLHFKLQETENDDNRRPVKKGQPPSTEPVKEALDGGDLGPERKLYLRELIARFGHALALNWNLGEENTQSPEQQKAMAAYIQQLDPYQHPRVIHSYPNEQDKVYPPLLGPSSGLIGASLQNDWNVAHQKTLKWLAESARAGVPWVVANDEQGTANLGVPPDPGYQGFSGKAGVKPGNDGYDIHDVRKATLWGTLMAGGAGVEYYFGYGLPQNDLVCEDLRSRDKAWDHCRIALDIFKKAKLPFWEMSNANALVGNSGNDNSRYCLAKPGEVYAVYLPSGGTSELDLSEAKGDFSLTWWNPRQGGRPRTGALTRVKGGQKVSLGTPPAEADQDWLVIARRR